MLNILTFDVEDWYHGLDIPEASWPDFEHRLPVGLEFILSTLAAQRASATFFVLGVAAREYPDWVRSIADAGYEIGTHGWSHTPIYRQCPAEFRAELARSLDCLQSLSGRPVYGHRAAMFSVTARSLWALDELSAAGLSYDSSIFPVHNYRYGVPGGRRHPYRLSVSRPPLQDPEGASACESSRRAERSDCCRRGMWELPVATCRIGRLNVPVGGGFYARFWPYWWLSWCIRRLNAQGQPAVVYFHPWEFDPKHPKLHSEPRWLARATHYHRLSSTRETLRRLLRDFQWTSALQFVSLRQADGCNRGRP